MIIHPFKHSQFDPESLKGFLAYYYAWNSTKQGILSEQEWRLNSFFPKILNFKAGRDKDIQYFVEPFSELANHALSTIKEESGYLVPVPSSIKWDDPNFKRTPKEKGDSRNRDDRNVVFCGYITAFDSRLKLCDILKRIKSKEAKSNQSAQQHANSFQVTIKGLSHFPGPFILVDDVSSSGDTLDGAEIALKTVFPQAKVIKLTIGQTNTAGSFQPS